MGAIFRGLQMAVTAEEKLASQIDPAFMGRGKLVSEIGPDSSPGIIDSESTRASSPRDMPSARCSGDTGLFPSPFRELPQPNQPSLNHGTPWNSHGITMGPRWDFSPSNPFRKGTLRKKSHKKVCAGHATIAGTPSLPQVPIPPIFTCNQHRIIHLQDGNFAI